MMEVKRQRWFRRVFCCQQGRCNCPGRKGGIVLQPSFRLTCAVGRVKKCQAGEDHGGQVGEKSWYISRLSVVHVFLKYGTAGHREFIAGSKSW